MFLLSQGIIQALIIGGSIILFLGSFILNRRTSAPKGVDVPEHCQTCASHSCIVKMSDIGKIKEELREQIDNCDGEVDETQ